MIIAGFLEALGVGVIVPFIGLIMNPESIHENTILIYIYNSFSFENNESFILFFSLAIGLIFVFKNLFLIFFTKYQNDFLCKEQSRISTMLFESYLAKPYVFHLSNNSSELLRNIFMEVQKLFEYIIFPFFLILSETITVALILAILLIISPLVTLVSISVLALMVGVFFKLIQAKTKGFGLKQQYYSGEMLKWINQGFGIGKELKILGREHFFKDKYFKSSNLYARYNSYSKLIVSIPRMYIETLVFLLIITLVLLLSRNLSSQDFFPILALFAASAVRLMPSINRIISSINSIKYFSNSLDIVINDIQRAEINNGFIIEKTNCPTKLVLKKELKITLLKYSYPESEETILDSINFGIKKGEIVGFAGTSGSGKTTLVDLIMGILDPTEGQIFIDGSPVSDNLRSWQANIGYVPQNIFLTDDTITNNVAFAINEKDISIEKVWDALDKAQMKGFVKKLPQGLDTIVGERGVRLSGGERQRIGIARALYHDPEILVFDEATSALDNSTEKEVMKAIYGLRRDKTIILIAHRLSTLEDCDVIYEMKSGRIVNEIRKSQINKQGEIQ